jgi:hypothetical protein
MGYDSRLSGSLVINPPLTHHEMWDHRELTDQMGRFRGVTVKVEQSSATHPYGTVTTWSADTVGVNEETGSFYDWKEELQAIVDAFPGHTFHGWLQRTGADPYGDMERLWVVDGKVVSVHAQITWPGRPDRKDGDT